MNYRYNQTLCSSLVKYVNDNQDDWDRFIDRVLFAYRTTVSKSTNQTPFFLAFGKNPKLLIEDEYPVGEKVECDEDESLTRRIETMSDISQLQKQAQVKIKDSQAKYKKYFDAKHAAP